MSTRLVRPMVLAALATGMTLLSLGCSQSPSTQGSASSASATPNDVHAVAGSGKNATTELTVEKAREAAQVVEAIRKDPRRANEILEAHGTNQEAFKQLLFDIAQDPEMTEAYEAARTAASP